MHTLVEEIASPAELEKCRINFKSDAFIEDDTAQLDYAWCLVRGPRKEITEIGLKHLKDLYRRSKDEDAKRCYLFYLAIGNTRIKEYSKALKLCNAILLVEPNDPQTLELINYIEKKQKKDGMIGMAIVGSAAAVVIGGLVGIGVALSKK